jgi:HPt (histidine-containing phosphotransfer) domain-containing protein
MGDNEHDLLDRQGVLERLDGDQELYDELIQLFFEDVPAQLTILRGALDSMDRALGERQAHSLKSAAANIGAESMRAVCFRLEKAFQLHEQSELRTMVSEVEAEFTKLQNVLREAGI